MNTKWKYIFAFVAVLLIGFILGFLTSGRLIHSRVTRMQKYYTNQGFRYELRRVLHPTPEQLKKMKPILQEYGQKNRENMMLFRQQQQQLMKALHHDLKPFLSPQQINRLEKMEYRHGRLMRKRAMPHPAGNARRPDNRRY